MNELIHALVIVAHPDDESFLFAGTTLKLQEEGKKVAVICATRGEKGADRLNRKLSPLQMAAIRAQELLDACQILDCECQSLDNYPDGELDRIDFKQLVSSIAQKINTLQPRIILTFGGEGISGHRDHITIGKAVTEACQRSRHRPEEIWRAGIPSSLIPSFREHMEIRKVHHAHFTEKGLKGVPDKLLTKISIKKYKDTKLKALEAHESQYLPHLTWPEFLENEYFEVTRLP